MSAAATAASLSAQPHRFPKHYSVRRSPLPSSSYVLSPADDTIPRTRNLGRLVVPRQARVLFLLPVAQAGSRADDSAPSGMSLENAPKLLGVPETASFDEILRAKNSILAACDGNEDAVSRVEAAYDMLLMRSLTKRRAGKVVSSSIRYADVKTRWHQQHRINAPVATIQRNDVPGLIQAGSFGASLYFMTRRNVKLGKASIITMGALVAGAAVGSAMESWLQVDVIPFIGLHSPATVVSEFILFSQLLASL